MGKARKKKVSVTKNEAAATSSNPQATRTVIRQYHLLLKRQSQLKNDNHNDQSDELAAVESDLEKLGGLAAYQRMSTIGQGKDRGGGSERVLIGWLKDLGIHQNRAEKLQLLEVGALKHDNYRSCPWVAAHPMDLRSRHPEIRQQDFFLLDVAQNHEKWDAISLSLVLNFVPQARDRGKMLLMAHDMLKPHGLLFLALPLPCVANSRYLTFEHLKALMNSLGFVQQQERWKDGGKMAYWLYRKGQQNQQEHVWEAVGHKVSFREGNRRNNFSILV